jgi:isopentenyl-diphosphate delta-isomerase
MHDMVILVNETDEVIGYMKKMEAHEMGLLHRAFSILVFDSESRLLLHQRAKSKYHSGGLWTNTCCSHQHSDEDTYTAAHRRLLEEMGFDCDLEEKFSFLYRAEMETGLVEHEFDHVLVGRYDGTVDLNPHEVESYEWLTWEEIREKLEEAPEQYTSWFKHIYKKIDDIGLEKFI